MMRWIQREGATRYTQKTHKDNRNSQEEKGDIFFEYIECNFLFSLSNTGTPFVNGRFFVIIDFSCLYTSWHYFLPVIFHSRSPIARNEEQGSGRSNLTIRLGGTHDVVDDDVLACKVKKHRKWLIKWCLCNLLRLSRFSQNFVSQNTHKSLQFLCNCWNAACYVPGFGYLLFLFVSDSCQVLLFLHVVSNWRVNRIQCIERNEQLRWMSDV